MQRAWQHALPKSARASGARINLTFRRIRVPYDVRVHQTTMRSRYLR
jgi:hypothetical protein